MSLHVIVGAGPVGSATARLLAARGEQVRLITRSGSGPQQLPGRSTSGAGIECVAADASDEVALERHTAGAVALYSCAGPAYHRWTTDWPPLGAALVRAAEASGAVLVTTGNLYGYGEVDGPMTEEMPLRANSVKGRVRAKLWEDALAAHEAGRIRTAEVRGSDYLGAHAVSPFSVMVLPKVIAGGRGTAPADLDAPHSWTYVGDVARTLVAVAADEKAWGRPWHAPTPPPMSIRELAGRAAELAGAPAARVAKMPGVALRLAGLFNPAAREMIETQYQWQRPFVVDSKAATVAFGIEPTPTDEALRETIDGIRAQAAV
ncbi:nucleoside-diphosphate-sugar epimerase [Kribbella steppae]|uniref:Nucleoside-diphosphate-sugar epimerase n=1 Tax=Kribbella steppae TaxID=2512223 RepID=A0A4V2RYV0_9ACTN|nr:NAD-dependent epimerase/dehydratase family protein [Kribbella steppae]TCO22312.1 nucleoside-diphosphate-sugar epimerase [Kribbella steppae]